ncbi:MAG: CPBP family intramembrane glutamic endopeptidase [Candidatus Eisenbacteria bacterium]
MPKRVVTLRTLLFTQVVALAAVAGIFHVLFRTERGLAAKANPVVWHVARFLQLRLRWPDGPEILLAGAVAAALVLWNHLYQRIVPVGDSVTEGEWRPVTAVDRAGAAVLVVTTAVTEEILFRGVLYAASAYFLNRPGGLLLSALLFSLAHSEKGTHGRIAVFVYGLILGAPLFFGSSLAVPIIAHGILNGVAFFGLFGTGRGAVYRKRL